MISNIIGIQHIAELFIREGIEHIVISPGSRNAPMMLTFPEYKELKCYSIIDERSAGFFALGIAHKTQKPVVLNCTSGSALLNYAPAIAEAYYQNIPLIVLSADRPEKLIDNGDGQAIRQNNIFQNFIRKSVNLPENPITDSELKNYQYMVLEAILMSKGAVKGPVHINVPLDEPIYNVKEKENISLIHAISNEPIQQLLIPELEKLIKIWQSSAKKLILIGQNPPDAELNEILVKLASRDDVVIMTETTSNQKGEGIISNIDSVLSQVNEQNVANLYPDLLITFGGHIVSKKIKALLRKDVKYTHWHISKDSEGLDTFFHLSNHIQCSEIVLLKKMIDNSSFVDSDYHSSWNLLNETARKRHNKYISEAPYSDLLVFENIRKYLPQENINLHFANSTPIRYSQLFNYSESIIIDSNRGVSGIDGSISTALGASIINKEMTCLITGDLSFFYDSNALWNKYLHTHFRIIVINNGGGGIFRFIDGPMQSDHLAYFETPHQRTAKSLAKEAGLDYTTCDEAESLNTLLPAFFQTSDKAKLLEIFTPRELNDKVLKSYFSFLRKA